VQFQPVQRYAIKLDPIPLLLELNTKYSHVDEKIVMDSMIGKHKIEYYVLILVKWSHVSKWSHVTMKDAFDKKSTISEESIFSGAQEFHTKVFIHYRQ
jgi:hypothetical protein